MAKLRRYTSRTHAALRFVAQRVIMKSLVWSILDVTIQGSERLDRLRGPFILISNHSSHIDATLMVCSIPLRIGRYLSTGVAADYFFTKVHRKAFTSLVYNAFPIDRGRNRRQRSVAADLLAAGVPLLIFPEGSRSWNGGWGRFTLGAAGLAIRQQVPVVPAAVVGAHDAMPRGRSWPRPGRPPVTLTFGEPTLPEPGETPVNFSHRLQNLITSLHDPVAQAMGLPTMAERGPSVRPGSTSRSAGLTAVRSTEGPGGAGADTGADTGTDAGPDAVLLAPLDDRSGSTTAPTVGPRGSLTPPPADTSEGSAPSVNGAEPGVVGSGADRARTRSERHHRRETR